MSTCAHCGATDVGMFGPNGGGSAHVDGQPLCHPDSDDRPDCYHLVTVYKEPIGSRYRYSCCEHCLRNDDGACLDGVDNHALPCPAGPCRLSSQEQQT